VPTATQDDIGQLQALAEPYVYAADIRGSLLAGEVALSGIVKTPPGVTRDTPAGTVRLELLQSAERLIAAMEPAGWQLLDHVKLSFSTDVRGPVLTVAGEAMFPSRQEVTSLTVELRMLRAVTIMPARVLGPPQPDR
jgi:hypothetical protein